MRRKVAFESAAAGTSLEGARLDIEEVPVVAWCDRCQQEREPVDVAVRRCPVCQATMPQLIRGEELQVVGLEIEDV